MFESLLCCGFRLKTSIRVDFPSHPGGRKHLFSFRSLLCSGFISCPSLYDMCSMWDSRIYFNFSAYFTYSFKSFSCLWAKLLTFLSPSPWNPKFKLTQEGKCPQGKSFIPFKSCSIHISDFPYSLTFWPLKSSLSFFRSSMFLRNL